PRRHRPTDEPGPLVAHLEMDEAMRQALPVRFSLALDPHDTPEQVRTKERALARLASAGTQLSKWKRVADLWCARWFNRELMGLGPAFASLADAIVTGRSALRESSTSPLLA